ncbi:MAG: hypothetical protein FWC20_10930 [Oscillospiraceae bacterium]|nr:hypothetical protein [Oscillospiraceae bacterium]MCL2279900.1 hypothetical protein [Oscillospiraceae bacterium]
MQIETLLEKIEELRPIKSPLLIAIDGRCGSGKTTLAETLHNACGGNLFHMDDFYLRLKQRTPERYAEPGGNVDYERFLAEVLTPVQAGNEFSFRPFDIKIWDLGESRHFTPEHINIIEGSYSLHPTLASLYDIRVFLDIGKEEQMRRIVKRNGEEWAKDFRDRWIPLEELYFAAHNVHEICDYVWQTD